MDKIAKFVGYAVLAIIGIGVVAGLTRNEGISIPVNSCRVHTVKIAPEAFVINGQLDAGFKVTAVVENKGSQRQLVVIATLTSSEGDLQRKQTVPFSENESKELTYQFHEPTISATNISYVVSCK